MKKTNLRNSAITACMLTMLAATNALADQTKADNATALNDPASWVGNAVPGSTEFGVWNSTVTSPSPLSLGADMTWGGIKILDPGGPIYLNPGNTLTLDAPSGTGIDLSSAVQDLQLDCAVSLGATQLWSVASSRTLTVAGIVSGTNALIKDGAGTLILSNKTYSGGTTISNGLMIVNNDNGGYTMSGGSLLLEYDSNWSGPTISFTTDAEVGTDHGRLDFSGVMGAPGFRWTKTGTGGLNTTYWQTNLHVVQASSILVAAGTLGSLPNSTALDTNDIAQWGGPTVTITVSNVDNAALAKYDSGIVPNPIILQGDSGNPNGTLQTARINGDSVNPNPLITFQNTLTLLGSSPIPMSARYGVMVLAGNISGPGGVDKLGANTMVLAGTNTYGADTRIDAGTIQLGSSSALPGGTTNGNVYFYNTSVLDLNGFNATVNGFTDDNSGGSVVDNTSANPATLTVGGNNQSVSLVGPVRNTGGGALSIVKVGSDAAKLLGVNTYSGSNIVNGGSLEINIPTGTTSGGALSVADNSTLTLDYRVSGSSLRAAGATFGTSGATTLNVALGNFGNPSKPVINATNGTGLLSANGTITVYLKGNGGVMGVGQFPLIKYTTRTGTGTFVLSNQLDNVTAQIVTNAGNSSIDIKITSAPVTTWVGNVNNLWDVDATANWKTLGVAGKYTDGIAVVLDDSALTNNVELTTTLAPAVATVNTTNNYVFSGPGALTAINNADLYKNGSGTLTLLQPQYYNNTIISGGTLQLADGPFGTGGLGGGTVDDEVVLAVNSTNAVSIGNTISGAGSLIQQGTGTLTVSGANTYSGGTTISQGVVKAGNASALGAPATGVAMATVASGATLDLGGQSIAITNVTFIGGSGYAIMNSGGGTCIGCGNVGLNNVNLTADATLSGNNDWTIGNSGLGLSGNNHSLTKLGGGWLYLHSAALTPFSQFVVGGGGIVIESANPFGTGSTLVLSNNAATDSWGNNSGGPVSYTIANNIIITNGGGRLTTTRGHWWSTPDYDTYSGSITLYDKLTVQNSSANGSLLGRLTVSGPISGSGPVVKLGANQVTFSGANSYTGLTTVSNGVLAISATSSGGGDYTVNDGATLDVPAQTSAGTLSMTNLTLGASTGCNLSLTRVLSLSTNPVITATNLTLNGSTIVAVAPGAFAVAGQFPLIKFSGAIAGSGTIALGASVRGLPGTIVTNVGNSSIDLLVPSGNPVFWTGSANNVWDIANTSNFKYLGSATTYQQPTAPGDAVTFDDTGANTTVNLSVSVSPTLITVTNASKTYVFTNSVIAGTGGLLKQGTGMLVLSNGANTFTGGATITGGTVQLGNDGSLNNSSGTVTVSGNGTLDFNTYNPTALACTISGSGFNGQGTLIGSGSDQARGPKTVTLAGSATIGGAKRWDLRASGAALNSPTNAYTLTKVGANLIGMVATTVSPTLGDIYVLGGRLGFQTSTTGYGDTNKTIYLFNGGGLEFYQTTVPVNKSIICSNGAALQVDGGGSAPNWNIIAAPISNIIGTLTLDANYGNGMYISNVISGNGDIYVQWNGDVYFSATNTFKGDFKTQGRVRLIGNASINPTNVINVNNGGSGLLYVQDNAVVGGQNLQLWSGPATGALIVKNNGTINTKNIQVGNAFADWSGRTDGTFTMQSGQTLRIDNGGRIKGNVVAVSGSTFTPGGSYYIQNTGVLTNNLTLQAGSTTYMDVSLNGGVTNNDAVTVLSTLTYGGTLQINNMGTNALVAGNTFKLFTFSTTPVGSFATVTANTPGQFVTWDTSQLSVNGTLRVASVTSSSNPTLGTALTNNTLYLSWPADHLGWRLLIQTNNLVSGISVNHMDWGTVPGSTNTTSVTIPINPSTPCEFYRLTYP